MPEDKFEAHNFPLCKVSAKSSKTLAATLTTVTPLTYWLMLIVDKWNGHGGDRKSPEIKTQNQVLKNSSETTAEILGISKGKVEQLRTVIDHADPQTIKGNQHMGWQGSRLSLGTQCS